MNLHQLRIFHAVARHMSFSAAARELFITQPAVSLQVRALEESLGVKLLDRSTSKLELTEAGDALIRSAVAILNAEDEARRVLAEFRDASKAKLIVGTNTTGGMYLLPRILRAYRVANPNVELVLDIDATDAICDRIHQKMIDIGVVGGPIEDRRMSVEAIVEDEVVLIVSPDHPFAQRTSIALADLKSQRLIVMEPRSRTRVLVERTLRQQGLAIQPAMQLVGTEAVKKAVESNLGIGFVSSFAIEREVRLGDLRRLPIDGLQIARPLVLLHRSSKYLSPAAKRFREFLQAYVAEHTDEYQPPSL